MHPGATSLVKDGFLFASPQDSAGYILHPDSLLVCIYKPIGEDNKDGTQAFPGDRPNHHTSERIVAMMEQGQGDGTGGQAGATGPGADG